MPTYFRPLRRKFGVITLVLACLFLAFWVRSYRQPDLTMTIYGAGNHSVSRFSVKTASFVWERIRSNWEVKFVAPFVLLRRENSDALIPMSVQDAAIQWSWNFCGFAQGNQYQEKLGNTRLTVWKIPCWSIVIPLTLLSGWLLLSKLRAGKPAELRSDSLR